MGGCGDCWLKLFRNESMNNYVALQEACFRLVFRNAHFSISYTSSPRGNYLAAAQGPELHSTRNELGKSDFPGPIVPIRNNLVKNTASAAIMTRRKHSFYYKKKPCT